MSWWGQCAVRGGQCGISVEIKAVRVMWRYPYGVRGCEECRGDAIVRGNAVRGVMVGPCGVRSSETVQCLMFSFCCGDVSTWFPRALSEPCTEASP